MDEFQDEKQGQKSQFLTAFLRLIWYKIQLVLAIDIKKVYMIGKISPSVEMTFYHKK